MHFRFQAVYICLALIFFSCSGTLNDPGFASNGTGNASISPSVTIRSFKNTEYLKGGSVYNVKFTVTDPLGFDSNSLEFSRDNGVTWSSMASASGQSSITFATSSGVEASFDWAVPVEPSCAASAQVSDSNQVFIRIFAKGRPDAAITQKKSAATAVIDSCPPKFSVDQLVMSGQDKGFINFTVSGLQDAFTLSPINAICIKANSAVLPTLKDSCWRSLAALQVPASAAPSPFTVNYFAGFVPATFNFYAWAADAAGNISTMNSDSGTLTTDLKGTDFIENVARNCVPASTCTLNIPATLTANTTATGSGLLLKAGAPTTNVSDPKYFVITARGNFIYRDAATSSIKKINFFTDVAPVTLIANAATIIDGDQTAARVFRPTRLALDFNENLYILDNDRIRKVTFTTDTSFTVQTIIGGGAATGLSLVDPLTLQMTPIDRTIPAGASLYWYGSFEVISSGDIYFSATDPQTILDPSGTHALLRYYSPLQTNQISALEFSGLGVKGDATVDTKGLVPFSNFGLLFNSTYTSVLSVVTRFCEAVGTCARHDSAAFSSSTGISLGASGHPFLPGQWSNGTYFNSRKGDLFHVNTYGAQLLKLNPVTLNWGVMAGNGIYPAGFCADNTAASSCPIRFWDSYVGYNDMAYFIDYGRLRFIDLDGRVKTIAQ